MLCCPERHLLTTYRIPTPPIKIVMVRATPNGMSDNSLTIWMVFSGVIEDLYMMAKRTDPVTRKMSIHMMFSDRTVLR